MKTLKKISLIVGSLLLAFVLFVLYIFSSTGYFREIIPNQSGGILQQIELPGAEDITVSYTDHFALISSDDRAARRDGNPQQGGLYYIDLKEEPFKPKLISEDFDSPFYPHGISTHKIDSAHYKVWVINHVREQHSIEVFELFGDSLVFRETLRRELMVSPNDVVAVSENQFYFTNDHKYTSGLGLFIENYGGLAISNVIYFDGADYREVADGIAYANGINWDPNRKLLFVASPRDFMVKVYKIASDGELIFEANIDAKTGIDNLELDQQGNIWSGAHPNLLAFTSYAAGKNPIAPSEVVKITYTDKDNYLVESVYVNDGGDISASSVAVPYQDKLLIGNVMDEGFLVIKINQ
ncbi:MAG: SMP-30/gluconolactonase/LRE family protein [Cyclobacteriaceae bacterium]